VRIVPLKRLVQTSRPITYGIVQAGPEVAEGVPYIRPVDMTEHDGCRSLRNLPRTSAEIASQYQRSSVIPGDIVVSIGPSYGKTMIVPDELAGANLTQGTARVAVSPANDARFVRWCLRSAHSIAHWDAAVGGATFRALNLAPLAETPVPLLPRSRQTAIADYLDTETARIDALIAKKQRIIELLVVRRLSTIEECLGGGRGAASYLVGSEATSHRAVPMKRLLSDTIAGGTPDSNDSDYWTDEHEGIAWVAIGDMADCSITTDTAKRLTPVGLAASRLRVAPAGTLLFAMYASLGKLTVTAVPCVWNQAIIGLIPDRTKADAEYVALWLEALRPHLALLARSTTQDNLNAEQVRSLPVPLITVEEQRRLVLGLLPVLQQVSAARSVLERQIELLREHRQALITAAVTGKLELPGVAA
jgi:type I restriction enzyme S subunit